jgi:hypothetical protein
MFRDFQVKIFAGMFILSFVLSLNLLLFLYSISQDLLLIASSIHIGIVSINISAVAMLLVLAYIIKHSNTIRPYHIIYVIVFITLITSMFEYSLSLMNGLTEVGEQVPDATIYTSCNHWIFSIKNPYYDIINVASFWIAMLHMILGVNYNLVISLHYL